MNKPQIWEKEKWPSFYYNTETFKKSEQQFHRQFKNIERLLKKCSPETILEAQSNLGVIETVYTSRIEGVNLNTNSIFESFLNNIPAKREEKEAMSLLKLGFDNIDKPITHALIQAMNKTLLPVLQNSGTYVGNMKIIEGNELIGKESVIYEGVPKDRVNEEMCKFIDCFNSADPKTPIANAVRGHIHFESIHPFPDGNGRVGRTLMLMGLCRDLKTKVPLAISRSIEESRNDYYKMFNNRTYHQSLDISPALQVMHPVFMASIEHTIKIVNLSKVKQSLNQCRLNKRQERVMNKLINYELGEGFKGGLSNEKYRKIAKCESKTAQRDLQQLKRKGLLVKEGSLKSTRYFIPGIEKQKENSR